MNVGDRALAGGCLLPDPWTTKVRPQSGTLEPYFAFVHRQVIERTSAQSSSGAKDLLRFVGFLNVLLAVNGIVQYITGIGMGNVTTVSECALDEAGTISRNQIFGIGTNCCRLSVFRAAVYRASLMAAEILPDQKDGGETPDIWPMRMPGVVFVPSGSGVVFRSDGTTFAVAEPGSYELLQSLMPRLDGRASLREIAASFDVEVRPFIEWLVPRLVDRGIVRNEHGRCRCCQPEAVRRQFAAQLALIDHLGGAAEEHFEWVRQSRVLVVGAGASFRRCAAALVRNGVGRLWVADRDELGRVPSNVVTEAETLRAAGVPCDVHASDDPKADQSKREPLSMVLYVADSIVLRDLAFGGRCALREGCALLPAFFVDRQALIGPVVQAPGCAVCTFRRLAVELCGSTERETLIRRLKDGSLGRGVAAASHSSAVRLGSEAAFEAFKFLAGGLRPQLAGGVILETITEPDSVRAVFVPYTLHWCGGWCAFLHRPDEQMLRATAEARPFGAGDEQASESPLLFRPTGRDGAPCHPY
jgi:hypothetical protein